MKDNNYASGGSSPHPLYSYKDLAKRKFEMLEFEGEWLDLIGKPERSGAWIIWGMSGNGKTRFALKLAKYLSSFERVYYNTLEEGFKVSFKRALEESNIQAVDKRRFNFQSENLEQMKVRLSKKRSPNIIFIDSLQYLDMNKYEFEKLLKLFPKKLFIFISHAKGREPKGEIADAIRYHCDVKIEVHQFLASPRQTTRFGGSKPMIIWEEGYKEALAKQGDVSNNE